MDAYERVCRNTVEVVTGDDLRALLAQPHKKVYAGYEPSGEIHLGHLVTINKLVDLQPAGFEVTVLLADLHAFLNRKGTMETVGKLAEYNKRCFEGLGLKNVNYILGSELQLNRTYELLVSSSPNRSPSAVPREVWTRWVGRWTILRFPR